MPVSFNRIVKVTAYRQSAGSSFVGSNPQFFDRIGNALEISEDSSKPSTFRIKFDVTKNLGKEPNKCEIRIFNLSEHDRSDLEKLPLSITLAAGHDGIAKLLFIGDLRRAYAERDGTDIAMVLQVADGSRAFKHARMDRSYKPPIRVSRVLEDCAKSMGLKLPPEVEQSAELKQALATGISTHGPTRDVLSRLLAPYGYHWSIQNGRLLILRDDTVAPGDILLVNSTSGPLINEPKKTTPDKPGGKTEISFDSLLYAEMMPGRLVKLQSEFLDVNVKTTDIKHVGDTYGAEFTTSVTSRPL